MSSELPGILKFNVQTVVIKKFEVFDQLGSSVFTVSSVDWSLVRRSNGVELLSGSATIDNSDTDQAGNAIKTASLMIDLRATDDHDRGSYYLVMTSTLSTQQTDIFRASVEMVDYRKKGAA